MTRYALSIRQPWASLIVDPELTRGFTTGVKNIENRSWQRSYRGELYIHVGQKSDPDAIYWLRSHIGDIILPANLPTGGIIGKVIVEDIVYRSDSPWHIPGQWGWVLSHPEAVDFIPMRGQLGIFEF